MRTWILAALALATVGSNRCAPGKRENLPDLLRPRCSRQNRQQREHITRANGALIRPLLLRTTRAVMRVP